MNFQQFLASQGANPQQAQPGYGAMAMQLMQQLMQMQMAQQNQAGSVQAAPRQPQMMQPNPVLQQQQQLPPQQRAQLFGAPGVPSGVNGPTPSPSPQMGTPPAAPQVGMAQPQMPQQAGQADPEYQRGYQLGMLLRQMGIG